MRSLVVLLAAFALVLLPAAALGSTPPLQPGVHVDPGSPAGKEYQIPITAARGQGAGGSTSDSTNPPLFGVGVKPPTNGGRTRAWSSAARSRSTVRAHRRSSASANAGAGSAATGSGAPAGSSASPSSSSSDPGGSGWIALVAGGLLVLVLGGGGGLALRQRALRG